MDKENVIHIYSVQLVKKNKIMSFIAIWMDVEIIILSELSQRQVYNIAYMWNLTK